MPDRPAPPRAGGCDDSSNILETTALDRLACLATPCHQTSRAGSVLRQFLLFPKPDAALSQFSGGRLPVTALLELANGAIWGVRVPLLQARDEQFISRLA